MTRKRTRGGDLCPENRKIVLMRPVHEKQGYPHFVGREQVIWHEQVNVWMSLFCLQMPNMFTDRLH